MSTTHKVDRHPLTVRWCPECKRDVYVERRDREASTFTTDKGNRIEFPALAANCCPKCKTACLPRDPRLTPTSATIRRTGDPAKDAELAAAARARLGRSALPQPSGKPADDLYPPRFGGKP